eukprot:4578319-Prymnesium_polylepis.1
MVASGRQLQVASRSPVGCQSVASQSPGQRSPGRQPGLKNEHICAYHALERPHNAKTCMRKRPIAEKHPAEAHGACPERCKT